jgi:hypothetical protein
VKEYFKRIFTLDTRALAFSRCLMGCILIWDLTHRLFNAKIFYSDQGVVTRADFMSRLEMPFKMTLLSLSGSIVWVYILGIIGISCGVCLILNKYVKVAKIIGWIVLASFQARNPLLAHGGDNLFRLSLFFFLFMPVSNPAGPKFHYFSTWSIAWISQIFFIYFFTSIYKTDPTWMKDFSALYYATSIDSFLAWPGSLLQGQTLLLKIVTLGTILLESFGVLLFFVPWKQSKMRSLCVISFILFHLGIGLTFRVGIFSTAASVAWASLAPKELVDWICSRLKKQASRLAVVWHHNKQSGQDAILEVFPKFRSGLAVFFFFLIFSWNVEGLYGSARFDVKSPFTEIAFFHHLNQQWNMFAPNPMKNDGWFIVKAQTETGEVLDLLNLKSDYSEERPRFMADRFQDSQWRKFLFSLREKNNEYFRGRFLRYLCLKYETYKIKDAELILMQERTPAIEKEAPEIKKISLWVFNCSEAKK